MMIYKKRYVVMENGESNMACIDAYYVENSRQTHTRGSTPDVQCILYRLNMYV